MFQTAYNITKPECLKKNQKNLKLFYFDDVVLLQIDCLLLTTLPSTLYTKSLMVDSLQKITCCLSESELFGAIPYNNCSPR